MNNLLVVFKKNHEQVHDGALSTVISTLDKAKQTYGFEFRTVPREEVERDDFMGPEAVIVLGGDGTLTSIAHPFSTNIDITSDCHFSLASTTSSAIYNLTSVPSLFAVAGLGTKIL